MNDLLLRALRSEPVERPPVWFMRQAGRYLPEYHQVRNSLSGFLELCRTPEAAAEVTLQPLRRFPLDASIVFNDILVPPAAMGLNLEFIAGRGPVFHDPLVGPDDLKRLHRPSVADEMPHVLATIKRLVAELDVPLFGFAGAPFTLAAYMIEGGGSKTFTKVKRFAFLYPDAFQALIDLLVDIVAEYLNAQIAAGCAAVQLFDTWAGAWSPADFERWALAPAKRVLDQIQGVPKLYYTKNSSPFLHLLPQLNATAYAIDWRVDLDRARAALGDVPVMGNLDPESLHGPPAWIRARSHRVIRAAGPRGHVFNLGHGIGPTTPIDGVHAMVDAVREWSWSEVSET